MKKLLTFVAITAISLTICAQPKLTPSNIDDVVKALTLQEKASLLVGYTMGQSYFGLPSAPDPNAKEIVPGAAGNTASIQRLGIPYTVVSDGPAGLRIAPVRKGSAKTYYCTGFPVGTCLASTWNTELVTNVGKAMGNEVLEYGVDVILGPGMNLHRNPLCGRNFEYYSEDPFLTGNIAAAMVNGIQSNGVGVSIKHFAANNQESNRLRDNSVVSERVLRELYLKGFEIAIRKSNPWTVMSSYNKINGVFSQECLDLLTTVLRDEWGFKGIVMTDWTNTRNTAAQIHAGNDLMMPGNKEQIDDIIAKVKAGTLNMADVDICVKRVLQYIIKTPHFKGYKFNDSPDLKAHAQITRQSALEGMVLLKNDHQAMPLADNIKNIALFGITSYNLYAGGTGSGDVNKPYVVDLMQGLTNAGYKTDTLLDKIYTAYKTYAKQETVAEMGELAGNAFFSQPRIKEPQMGALAYANTASINDMAIITIGRSAGEGGDRFFEDFYLGNDEQAMVKGVCDAFHKLGKKVVVILNVGGVIETQSWKSQPDAILLAWQPGQEGGNSIADILRGETNPSGKLTMTFPIKLEDVPSTANFPRDFDFRYDWKMKPEEVDAMPSVGTTNYNEGLNIGYRYFSTTGKDVSYPFGYGLSYTTFEYSKAKINQKGNIYNATVLIKNTGDRAGKETVQLYVSAPKSTLDKPKCELKAFAKTRLLQPGESMRVSMEFSNYDLASYDENISSWVTDAGNYTALFGSNVADIRQNIPFKAKYAIVKCHRAFAQH
jgi:beta-glucosidase